MIWEIGQDILEFEESKHLYKVNGKATMSITQLLHLVFPDKYKDIDPEILKRAANRGSLIHAIIQVYEELGIEDESLELHNWKFLKKQFNLKCVKNEIPVIVRIDDYTFAGRLDLVLEQDAKLGLADIKTTSVLDKEYLGYQLNLYRIGYEQCYNERIDFLSGVHLRKDTRKYVNIPIKEEQVKNKIIEIMKGKENE